MPMIDLKDKDGNVKWISIFPFNTIDSALSYIHHSTVPLKIIKAADALYWVVSPEDAKWAIKCGLKEVVDEK